MAKLILDREAVEAAVLGGAVLGGGGGGSMGLGREAGLLAIELGDPELVGVADLPGDAGLLTMSAVGAPAAKTAHVRPAHYLRTVDLFVKQTGTKVDGLITNECGGMATVNGWLQAAALGLPVVDAPCNGRAHPTGVMGSMGLHRVEGYISRQVAVGGNPRTGSYVEAFVSGNLEKAAGLVRQAAVQAGGLVAVARNPVAAAYARENGAVGAVKKSIDVGLAMNRARAKGPKSMIEATAEVLSGEIVSWNEVIDVTLETTGGFDVGRVVLRSGAELTFWNEYITMEDGGNRIGTFPDLLATLDANTGLPVSSAEIRKGQSVAVLHVPQAKLILGAGMKDPALFESVEKVIGKEVIKYAF